MKNKFIIIIFTIFLIIPSTLRAANSFVVTELIYEDNILGKISNLEGRTTNTFWIGKINQKQGASISCGDVDGDGLDEIITSFKNNSSEIKIFSQDGKEKYKEFKAYDNKYRGGVDITLGDINKDGKSEIITIPREGKNLIKAFDYQGNSMDISFYPFTENFHGRVDITTGDINGDGREEIIITTGEEVSSEVKIFDNQGELLPINYYPFAADFISGVSIASGDLEGDGQDEIVICQKASGSLCKIYKYNSQRTIVNEWLVFENNFGAGVEMADIDRNGEEEIIVFGSEGGIQKIKIFRGTMEEVKEFNINADSSDVSNFDIFFDSNRDKVSITYVDDGDTIYLNDHQEVRYIGMDTPEIGEDFYVEATNRNKELLYNKEIELEYDQQKIDPYGRILAFVYADGEMVNAKLVEEGLARVKTFPPNEKNEDLLKEKQEEAQEKGVGIWSVENDKENSFGFWDIFEFFKMLFV